MTQVIHQAFEDWINKQKWIFAKTYAKKAPHEYVVKMKLSNDDKEMFEKFVMFIRKYGYEYSHWNKKYMCYDIDGRRYWTMGCPLVETIILNRADNENLEILNKNMT